MPTYTELHAQLRAGVCNKRGKPLQNSSIRIYICICVHTHKRININGRTAPPTKMVRSSQEKRDYSQIGSCVATGLPTDAEMYLYTIYTHLCVYIYYVRRIVHRHVSCVEVSFSIDEYVCIHMCIYISFIAYVIVHVIMRMHICIRI